MNATISKLNDALNAHDTEGMAALFSPDYRSEQPAHPNRGYGGLDTFTEMWGELFLAVPDLRSEALAAVSDGASVWVEWHWYGHYADGSLFEMRGITITELTDDGLVVANRIFAEPVEHDGPGIEEAERQLREPAH